MWNEETSYGGMRYRILLSSTYIVHHHEFSRSMLSYLHGNSIPVQALHFTSPVVDPVINLRVPKQRVLPIQHPMILIRETQEPTRNSQRLQCIEHRQTLTHGESVIQLIVHDELRRAEVLRVCHGIPIDVILSSWVFPQRAVEIMFSEP